MIVVPMVAKNAIDAKEHVLKTEGDAVELRLDAMEKIPSQKEATELFLLKKTILTNRRFAEGGFHKQAEKKRVNVLLELVQAKPWAVDVELKTEESLRKKLEVAAKAAGVLVIVSFHDFKKTPGKKVLERIVDQALSEGDIAKVVCLPKREGDDLHLMELVEKNKGRVVAFGLGDQAAKSRVQSMKNGAPFGFARNGHTTAPGQMSVQQMREALSA
ncbi:MAG TPA: type I 3-dehydroquinate dehydratase [Candidatus Norongarragalinales archaeon]|nr:type I 3-dehydroquinate dehydratase [Candidatus Norongarragalinales archaeon]